MADDCEIAQEITDRWLSSAVSAACTPKPKTVHVPNGKCRWCDDPVEPGVSFCPSNPGETGCRDDWEADRKRMERCGSAM